MVEWLSHVNRGLCKSKKDVLHLQTGCMEVGWFICNECNGSCFKGCKPNPIVVVYRVLRGGRKKLI